MFLLITIENKTLKGLKSVELFSPNKKGLELQE